MPETISTPVTKLFGIKVPILLAGMNQAAGPKLAAAVTNAGGLGVIGGMSYTPKMLRKSLDELVSFLDDKSAPYGVDLLLPKVGDGARATNYDYTKGHLDELVDVLIEYKVKVFVSAVGVPPKSVVERLHKNNCVVINMIGHVKHCKGALEAGADMLCCQGGEGGGHTGDVPTSVLIPKCVDEVKGRVSPLTGKPIEIIAAGGIFDGRGLAMALALGASAVWVGTRFICATEAGAPKRHQQGVIKAGYSDTVRTLIYTGRPLRVLKTPYVMGWEDKPDEIKALTKKGIIPVIKDMEEEQKAGKESSFEAEMERMPLLMGKCAGAINDIKPAKQIMDEMMSEAIAIMKKNVTLVSKI